MIETADVQAALARVRDPEVDAPITEMGFVSDIAVREDGVHIRLRLPTYFCAPNFTYLMMDDARRAVEEVAGAGRAHVEVDDHFESKRLNEGVGNNTGFSAAFDREANDGLDEIRDRFQRKTFLVRQERVCRELEAAGHTGTGLLALTVADLPATPARDDYLEARSRLGLSCEGAQLFLLAADGRPVLAERLRAHRRASSVLDVSYRTNGAMCQSLLTVRYPETEASVAGEEGARYEGSTAA